MKGRVLPFCPESGALWAYWHQGKALGDEVLSPLAFHYSWSQ